MIARPSVGVSVTLEFVFRHHLYLAVGTSVPVHRLVEVEGDASGVGTLEEGIALHTHSRCGSEFHADVVGLEQHRVVAGVRLFLVVTKLGMDAEGWLSGEHGGDGGHEGDVVQVACSCATEVGVAKSGNGAVGVVVTGDAVPSGDAVVGTELHHAEGGCRTRIGVAHPVCADHGVYLMAQTLDALEGCIGGLRRGLQTGRGLQTEGRCGYRFTGCAFSLA